MWLGLSNEELKSFAPDRLKPAVTKATTLSVVVMFIFSGWSGEGSKCFLAVLRAFWILWLQALGIDAMRLQIVDLVDFEECNPPASPRVLAKMFWYPLVGRCQMLHRGQILAAPSRAPVGFQRSP